LDRRSIIDAVTDRRTQISTPPPLISQRGFALTSVEDVIRESGLSGRALLSLLQVKDELATRC
jgi:hypothetical protein